MSKLDETFIINYLNKLPLRKKVLLYKSLEIFYIVKLTVN